MKTKCLYHNTLTQKYFFFLMIIPILIGMAITFTSLAHAEWNKKDDPRLVQSPQKQGWSLVGGQDLSSHSMKLQDKNLKTAAR